MVYVHVLSRDFIRSRGVALLAGGGEDDGDLVARGTLPPALQV